MKIKTGWRTSTVPSVPQTVSLTAHGGRQSITLDLLIRESFPGVEVLGVGPLGCRGRERGAANAPPPRLSLRFTSCLSGWVPLHRFQNHGETQSCLLASLESGLKSHKTHEASSGGSVFAGGGWCVSDFYRGKEF